MVRCCHAQPEYDFIRGTCGYPAKRRQFTQPEYFVVNKMNSVLAQQSIQRGSLRTSTGGAGFGSASFLDSEQWKKSLKVFTQSGIVKSSSWVLGLITHVT